MNKLPSKSLYVSKIYEDEYLDSFWALREALTYFASIRLRVADRLDAHNLVFMAYEKWFSLDAIQRDKILERYVINRQLPQKINYSYVKKVWSRTTEFFSEKSLQSLSSLKKARNNAAKSLHPDTGGDVESMQMLNQTYDLLHEIVSKGCFVEAGTTKVYADHGGNPLAYDKNDFADGVKAFYSQPRIRDEMLAANYFNLLVAEWNVDKAASFFGDGTKFTNLLARKGSDLFDAPDLERFICLCYKLGRPDICLAITKKYHDKRYGRLVEKISGGAYRSVPFKSSHFRVRNNITRLASVPLPKNLLKKSGGNESVITFSDFNFSALPSDPLIGKKPINISLIPHPWGSRAELDSNQSWEYHYAFYDIKDICLIKKYLYVRALALCEALVLHNLEPKIIRLELNLLNEVFKEDWLIRVQRFCTFISELSIEDQKLRRNILKELHVTSMQKTADLLRQQEYVEASRIHDNFVLSIRPSSRFLDNAECSVDRLTMALNTGYLDGPKERDRDKASWDAVINFRQENCPSGGWKSFEKYIDACLAFSAQTDHVEEFQICYYYNNLTVFLAKEKRWGDVRERLEQMFSLPERFFRRSNKSELEALRRRYARSKLMT